MTIALDSLKQTTADWINSQSYQITEWGWTGWPSTPYSNYQTYVVDPDMKGYIPTSMVIDLDGNVRWWFVGGVSAGGMEPIINELL